MSYRFSRERQEGEAIWRRVPATALHQPLCWSENLDLGKVGPIAGVVAREQGKTIDGGVRANIEVWQGRRSHSASFAVIEEALARQKAGLPGQLRSLIDLAGQRCVQGLYGLESDRYFSVNDGIDHKRRMFGALGQGLAGPCRPLRIIGGDVEKDIAVHKDTLAIGKLRSKV